jgi:Family of unknown function (DUF6518)
MENTPEGSRRATDSAALLLLAAATGSLLLGCVAELAHLGPAQIHGAFNSMGIYVLVYYLVLRRIATPAFGTLVLIVSLAALCVGYYGLAWVVQGGGRPFFFVLWCVVGMLLAPVMSYLAHWSTTLERKSGLAAGFIAGIFVGEILVGSVFFR